MKLTEKQQMQLALGAIAVLIVGLTTTAVIVLPKLNAQEKKITELLKK